MLICFKVQDQSPSLSVRLVQNSVDVELLIGDQVVLCGHILKKIIYIVRFGNLDGRLAFKIIYLFV